MQEQVTSDPSAWAVEWKKVGGVWKATNQRQVITVVEFKHVSSYYGVKMKTDPGVLTTYCVNPKGGLKCPSWVDTAFLPSNNGAVVGLRAFLPDGSTKLSSSFEPVHVGQIEH